MTPRVFISRRRFVALALAGTAAGVGSRSVRADEFVGPSSERWLELANTHTGETLAVAYRIGAGFVDGALVRLQRVLRDHRNDAQHAMDPSLYDQLADLALAAGAEPRFEIISGYRSPASNALLHARSDGVATRSLHMEGRAIDVRLKGVSCDRLRDLALAMQRGGVGYYRASDFVHVDTGRVRTWQG